MAHQVFICHSSKDKRVADAVCATLESHGIPCWIAPRDVMPSAEYMAAVVEALSHTTIVVVVFSARANESPQVHREVERAVAKNLVILPFRIENVHPTNAMEFALSSAHWLDALEPPLERHLDELCRCVAVILAQSSHAGAEPATMQGMLPMRPGESPTGRRRALDAIFALSASLCALMAVLQVGRVLKPGVAETGAGLRHFLYSVPAVIGLGIFAVTAAIARKRLYGRTVGQSLLWAPAVGAVIGGLLMASTPATAPARDQAAMVPMLSHLRLEPLQSTGGAPALTNQEILFTRVSPHAANPELLEPEGEGDVAYSPKIEVPTQPGFDFGAEITHNTVVSSLQGRNRPYEYRMCLRASTDRTTGETASSRLPEIWVVCSKDGTCAPAKDHASNVVACNDVALRSGGTPSVVYAAENAGVGSTQETREPGWVVPSLETLESMTDRERVGYTRFDVNFTPSSLLDGADHYFYAVRVNGTPVYVNGMLPMRTTYPLSHETRNTISFALENLAFRGEFDGFEHIDLAVTFLHGADAGKQLSLTRSYVALRDGEAVAVHEPLAEGTWTAKYIAPRNENRYNIDVEGSPNLAQLKKTKQLLDDAFARDHTQFAGQSVSLRGAVVTILRPPRYSTSYGLGLGIVLPTQQIQFTFNAAEAKEFCHWAVTNVKALSGTAPMRYDSATRSGLPCE